MATTEKYLLGTFTSLLSTGLNSLANNSNVLSAAYDNTQGGGSGDGLTLCDLELVVTFGANPTANTGVSIWFIAAPSGTYEDGDATTTPARAPDVVFPVRVVTTAQRIVRRAWLPWGTPKVLIRNDGTGQAFAATGNSLGLRPVGRQAV